TPRAPMWAPARRRATGTATPMSPPGETARALLRNARRRCTALPDGPAARADAAAARCGRFRIRRAIPEFVMGTLRAPHALDVQTPPLDLRFPLLFPFSALH